MQVVCLDLEGVLIPEIWVAFAEKTHVKELKRTTRDEPDYQKLMDYRLNILDKHGFKLPEIQEVIESMDPLPGAIDFVSKLRESHELVILSDTFREFAFPLMRKLNFPTLFCHELQIADDGKIEKVKIRLEDHKRKSVQYFQKLNFEVLAAGDSYNDLGMLLTANQCSFFNPPVSITNEYPDIRVCKTYDELHSFVIGN